MISIGRVIQTIAVMGVLIGLGSLAGQFWGLTAAVVAAAGLLMLALGFACLVWPRQVWSFPYRHAAKGSEPKREDLIGCRVAGAIMVFMALFFLFAPIVWNLTLYRT